MLPRLRNAEYRRDYRIWLRFADDTEGEIDLESELWGEVFQPLQDKKVFIGFALDQELGTIIWPNGADFAPEFLYQKLRPDYTLKPAPQSSAATDSW